MTENYSNRFSGLARLYGKGSLEKLARAHVAVIGIGGVGSWTAEALARSGIGELTLVDMDSICITNSNRQVHALDGNIGKEKVSAMAERLRLINPEIEIHERIEFFTENTSESILTGSSFEVVIDAIDSVKPKCYLIATCRERSIPIVVCGGAGGKSNPASVSRDDLAFATNDRLLKMVRKKLRREYDFPPENTKAPFGMEAVFSTENAKYPWADGTVRENPEPGSALQLDCESGFGTATQVTGTFGFAAAAAAIDRVLA